VSASHPLKVSPRSAAARSIATANSGESETDRFVRRAMLFAVAHPVGHGHARALSSATCRTASIGDAFRASQVGFRRNSPAERGEGYEATAVSPRACLAPAKTGGTLSSR
jgi:hypothetical protein